MDRRTTYAGSAPLETDVLWTGRYAMTAMAWLAQDILGTGTLVYGATVGPTTPTASMSVFVSGGRIYSLAPLEPSAWSSLAADATSVLKQGILTAAGSTIACPVLGSSGQSVNYLIEGQYQENDLNNVTLSYWNAGNPQLPFSGAGNNGVAQPTIRSGQFVCQAKAGTPATTGSQTTPTVDSGWVPLAVVTVAFGSTTITAGNISVAPNAPYGAPFTQATGQFTMTYVGGTGSPTATAYYSIVGPIATVLVPPISSTSNSTSFSFSGLPAVLQPTNFAPGNNQPIAVAFAQNNGTYVSGAYGVVSNASGSIAWGLNGSLTGWTNSGIKTVGGTLVYRLY